MLLAPSIFKFCLARHIILYFAASNYHSFQVKWVPQLTIHISPVLETESFMLFLVKNWNKKVTVLLPVVCYIYMPASTVNST